MKTWTMAIATASIMAISGCDTMTSEQRTVAGVAGGAAAGLVTAEALGASSEWRLISALAGAAAGTVVAQNNQRNVCAYARGDGTYYEAPCP
ncbi:glucose-6-phosphate isomerase [Roseovarius spongiae]|uniref:Glucose-6-phosphate isomerase n=1 Tax=Roseovarius spongiae TaxID=2320272 RepID=A0A3A8BC06_9RHOB|nr:glycine zipper 2TM domain-containing protein [Roseovarius spongiae]RKF17052.1 glucose-6-phosphate isomerase [Roseovarius spongiae]